MSFFHDDPPAPQPPRSALHRWTRRLLIAALVIGLLFTLSLRVLMSIGGNTPALKKGLEDYFTASTGRQAEIDQFNSLTFFPNITIDAADIHLMSPTAPPISIGGIKVTMSFWDMMFSRGRLHALSLTDIDLANTLPLPRPVSFDSISLTPTGPALTASGHYGADAFQISQSMRLDADGDYTRPPQSTLTFKSPFLNFEGALTNPPGGAHIDFKSLTLPNATLTGPTLTGNATLHRDAKTTLFTATLKGGQSTFLLTIQHQNQKTTGTLTTPLYNPADAKILSSLQTLYTILAPPGMTMTWPANPQKAAP